MCKDVQPARRHGWRDVEPRGQPTGGRLARLATAVVRLATSWLLEVAAFAEALVVVAPAIVIVVAVSLVPTGSSAIVVPRAVGRSPPGSSAALCSLLSSSGLRVAGHGFCWRGCSVRTVDERQGGAYRAWDVCLQPLVSRLGLLVKVR
jgi:hypothetical protein